MEHNERIPEHIAIIMDGNGRWASKKGKQRLDGHYEGVNSVKEVVECCVEFGVKYLTLYAFSTENWGRPKDEVSGLMNLFSESIAVELGSLIEKGVRMRFMGKLDDLSEDVRESIEIAEKLTSKNNILTVIVAINYSSRVEICDVVKNIAQDVKDEKIDVSKIDESLINSYLYVNDVPDPDLLIRTSGEERISNFLLWQIAYTELYFTSVQWPEFDKNEFKLAIEEYKKRNRRFGLITE